MIPCPSCLVMVPSLSSVSSVTGSEKAYKVRIILTGIGLRGQLRKTLAAPQCAKFTPAAILVPPLPKEPSS
jgi:hypothetical protein